MLLRLPRLDNSVFRSRLDHYNMYSRITVRGNGVAKKWLQTKIDLFDNSLRTIQCDTHPPSINLIIPPRLEHSYLVNIIFTVMLFYIMLKFYNHLIIRFCCPHSPHCLASTFRPVYGGAKREPRTTSINVWFLLLVKVIL